MRRYMTMLPAWLAALWLCMTPAAAAIHVYRDMGGSVIDYMKNYEVVDRSGGKIVIDGQCVSACTLALGILRKQNVCATERASFGFHSAWQPGKDGKAVFSADGTELVWHTYPAKLRAIIKHHGWNGKTEHPDLVWIDATELRSIVRPCTQEEENAA